MNRHMPHTYAYIRHLFTPCRHIDIYHTQTSHTHTKQIYHTYTYKHTHTSHMYTHSTQSYTQRLTHRYILHKYTQTHTNTEIETKTHTRQRHMQTETHTHDTHHIMKYETFFPENLPTFKLLNLYLIRDQLLKTLV